ncbi:MAG: pyruvate formate-lyase [Clostridia bacterium]|nr:pyruvate formate-lyase [Clostridia bacterium]
MTERVRKQLEFYRQREYRNSRSFERVDCTDKFKHIEDDSRHAVEVFRYTVEREKPLFHGDDILGFNIYQTHLPDDNHRAGARSKFGNITISYESLLTLGLDGIKAQVVEKLATSGTGEGKILYESIIADYEILDGIIAQYREASKTICPTLYNALQTVPKKPATDYYSALVSIRFVHYAMRLARYTHLTLGRFDQYAKPYYDISKKAGMSDEQLLELTELFFIAMNFDTDIYFGVQTGDNGQSMVLGGCDRKGNDAFNELSETCLMASEELCLIDPKINIRVNKNTSLSLYERGTRLTKQGLGFPQYLNDDISIPALVNWGYDLEDARDYAVAACWEIIIPGVGADIPNVDRILYPLAVEHATDKLLECETFDELLEFARQDIYSQCDRIYNRDNSSWRVTAPLLSSFMPSAIIKGKDITRGGGKYNNFGAHGAGIATAVDALYAIKKLVFDEKVVDKQTLLDALNANYEGYEDLRQRLIACDKMGNNNDEVDAIAGELMSAYVKGFEGKVGEYGSIYRPGTGTAMEYATGCKQVGATADGRKAQEYFACGFSPSLLCKCGPLSAITSFTKYDVTRLANGGPFTIELHDTVFRNEEGEKKVAMLVKSYIDLGGFQMQINAINKDMLLDAQANPEKYPNLIVRVWGWSGYFKELALTYQNHVIARAAHTFG